MDIDAVEANKPVEPKQAPKVDFTNPMHSHDWSKDKNVCARCGAERNDVRMENTFCEVVV